MTISFLFSNILIIDVILYVLIFFILTIITISMVLIGVRLVTSYKLSIHTKFLDVWEPKLFAFLESDITPNEFLFKLKSERVSNFLVLIRNYLNLLTGHDFDRLQSLLKSEKIISYFEDSLRKGKTRNTVEAIYYLGIFKNASYNKAVANFLRENDDEIYSHSARSLARMDANEYIHDILRLWPSHQKVSRDTLYSILIEFQVESCIVMHEILGKTSDNKIRAIILAAFTHFQYSEATDHALEYLSHSDDSELLTQSMKYFEELEFREASNELRKIFSNSSPELISQAIKTAVKISNLELEKIIFDKISGFNWQNKIDAINALYEMSMESREKLTELSNNPNCPEETSIAKMVISERELIES